MAAAGVPVPVRSTEALRVLGPDEIVTVAERVPTSVGLKATSNVHEAPGRSRFAQLRLPGSTAKSAGFGPVRGTGFKMSFVVLGFATVNLIFGLACPRNTDP